MRSILLILFALSGLGLTLSCGGGEEGGNGGTTPDDAGTEVSAAAMEEARTYYQNTCTPCHGAKGTGEGAAAGQLDPKPRDLTDPEFQDSITDEHIRKIILGGGAAVGKSAMMPPNPQLKSKPEVVEGLVQVVRGFAN